MRTEARAMGSLLVAIAIVGCGASQVSTPAPEPTEAVRPSVPHGWSTLTSDEGDVEVAVPPDFVVLSSIGGVLTQPPIDEQAAISTLEILAQGPALIEQPTGGESIDEWLERTGWLPRAGVGGVTAIADLTEQELILPSGRAFQVTVTVQPGTEDESRVAVLRDRDRGRRRRPQVHRVPAGTARRACGRIVPHCEARSVRR